MKKTALLLLQVSICLMSLGQNVTTEEAQLVAINHSCRTSSNTLEMESIQPIISEGTICMYRVMLTDGSWCYVSSDKRATPILAYGTSSDFFDDIPDAFLDLLDWYKDQIIDIKNHGRDSLSYSSSWDTLLTSTRAFPEVYPVGIGLLNNTGRGDMEWAQQGNKDGGCSPSYNQECPIGFIGCDCGHTPVGCGAVAMGMVMWYWQWPRNYQWEQIPPVLRSNTPSVEANMLATFLRECGNLCGMTYMCAGSSTIGPNIKSALQEIGYEGARVYDKDDWWPWAWRCLLLSEIDNGRPVIYYGQSSNINFTTGHFFVVDGYQYNPDLMFHINFGLGRSNAWCTLTDIIEISLTDTHNYSYQNAAIMGISPTYNEENITQLPYDRIRNDEWRTEYAYSSIHIPASNDQIIVDDGGRLYLEAGNEIILQPGFEARSGSEVVACINNELCNHMEITLYQPYGSIQSGDDFVISTRNADSWEFFVKNIGQNQSYVYQGAGSITGNTAVIWDNISVTSGIYRGELVLKNSYGRRYTTSFNIILTRGDEMTICITPSETDSLDENDNVNEENYREAMSLWQECELQHTLYPNPTSGKLTMAVMGEVQDIVIYNTLGQPVGGWNLQVVADDEYITLDVSPLPTGTYLLTVRTTDGKTRTGRFVKQ